ncbi:hypothetical protein A5819_003504 [Enterococcus sp. 7E2_DIV0204]|uniref:hypothetical protein n=1 Tax=unclassified Enterococcus TaxID=2608891 RepID=UPI000A3479C5|nr:MULTISPECIES: hypothetical protein [unclassified Enterococcus]OTN83954.1 hypothetical protein A5819_003504 [Enterococcus sp. 7E2_DIV0204]OTP46862.1 hypothetical protein A5884_003740 [Enterococcus sp. 7D2_DIV0200]
MNDRISDDELIVRLKELGTFYHLNSDSDEKDYRFTLNLHDMHTPYNGYNDFTLNDDASFSVGGYTTTIDINVIEERHYNYDVGLCSYGFAVTELDELRKLISIVYGSNFSVELQRIDVGWVRYEVKLSMLKCHNEYDLEINIRALRHIIVQILNQVKLQGSF